MALTVLSVLAAPAAEARRKPRDTLQVMRATDPVTRVSTCAVVASDYVGRTRFTQSGALYPVVESNGTYGLLVGVSSGGRLRLPTGDILWAVDNLPHRELRAADNPGAPAMDGPPEATVEAMTAYGMALSQAMTATSTMASGDKAREMLAEMLGGTSLLFRSAGAGPATGLPDYSALVAGQVNEKGELRAIPLDASFRNGLRECGLIDQGETGE